MASRQVAKVLSRVGNTVSIDIAEQVQHMGYRRLIDAIDHEILNRLVERVKAAVEGDKMLSREQATLVSSVQMGSSMDHRSELDVNEHSSLSCFDQDGHEVCNAHVTADPEEQQPAKNK
ncbi:hypothetical protein O1611_g6753 [Lasiodiplodia mahajangana]|uniref:Uncharacterized protein n=1 Tax=Lasiodiplodia mahajangana TaxID=1108764 RepID=A0ACC2JHL9_9PEZI|nr:hypothetical protein O1611_g6753 [Lasiodiplodia mahajangana]